MTNAERRTKLQKARELAVFWAERAELQVIQNPAGTDVTTEAMSMACMWAEVATALKTGDATGDTPDH